jgi:plasmid rolling circle replication initiator protein Rep
MAHNTINIEKLQEKKLAGLELAESFRRIGDLDRAVRVEQCGTFLEVAIMMTGDEKLTAANFCKERLCPACSWRRSVRIFSTTSQIMDYIDRTDENHKYLFLTLTVKNCPGNQLGATIDAMSEAFKRMTNNKAWQRRVRGSMRTLEVTINHESKTYHPHFHLILVVDKDYAKKGSKTYWTQEEWAAVWQKSARLSYTPSVWIEAVKGRRQGVEEVSKYMAKDADYILPDDKLGTDEIVSTLQRYMAGRRLISYTGIMREAQRALKLSDPENGPLTDDIRGDVACAIKRYHWSAGARRYVKRSPADA